MCAYMYIINWNLNDINYPHFLQEPAPTLQKCFLHEKRQFSRFYFTKKKIVENYFPIKHKMEIICVGVLLWLKKWEENVKIVLWVVLLMVEDKIALIAFTQRTTLSVKQFTFWACTLSCPSNYISKNIFFILIYLWLTYVGEQKWV